MIRMCAAVQAWLEFARHFLNMLKKEGCFFNKPDEVYGNEDILCLYRLRYKSENPCRFSDEKTTLRAIESKCRKCADAILRRNF
jgi:hypothetical protein